MEDFSGIINWNNIFKQSDNFQKSEPFKFAFIEDFFVKDIYEKLYNSYPKFDDTWNHITTYDKNHWSRKWANTSEHGIVSNDDDLTLGKEWNLLKRYASTDEFINNFKKFTNVPVTKLKHFHYIGMTQGGFQLPHIHDVGPSTLVLLLYFNENWPDGEPGGTYMSKNEGADIIFEPYNLDNSCMIFQDGPHAEHGVRYINRDTERKAVQITLEGWFPETGWSGGDPKKIKEERKKHLVEL